MTVSFIAAHPSHSEDAFLTFKVFHGVEAFPGLPLSAR